MEKRKLFINRKERECPHCFHKEYPYAGLFFRVDKKEVCYDCYYKTYATAEEVEINNMEIDQLPF